MTAGDARAVDATLRCWQGIDSATAPSHQRLHERHARPCSENALREQRDVNPKALCPKESPMRTLLSSMARLSPAMTSAWLRSISFRHHCANKRIFLYAFDLIELSVTTCTASHRV